MTQKNLIYSLLPIIFIIIIASFLRFYNLELLPPGLYPDEAMNGNNALEALSPNGEFKVFYPENNGREGLFINIQAGFVKFLGNKPWVLRLPSAIFGILTVLGLFFLTKILFKDLGSETAQIIALLAAFLLATSFWHINFSRIGFRAIMAPFFLTWAIYFLLKSIESLSAIRHKLYAITGGLLYGLGFYSYIAYRATPLLLLIILFLYRKQLKENWKPIFIFIIFTFLVALPLGLYFLHNPADFMGRTGQLSIFNSPSPIKDLGLNIIKTLGQFNISGDYNWRHNIAGAPLLFMPVGILFLIGVFMGIRKIREPKFIIIFSWLAITALPVVVSNEGIPHALRSIIMIPPVFILAGLGSYQIFLFIKKHIKFNPLVIITCSSILILLTIQAYVAYFITWGMNYNVNGAFAANYVEIGNQLNSLPKEIPKYVVVDANGALVRGIPMPSQTVMFITDTFTPEKQTQKNIHYILPDRINTIPTDAFVTYIK